jgi:beta-lactam-binding protein with PASTA domain
MDIKEFWKESFVGFIIKNLLVAIAIFVALAWGTLIAIDFYTHHGQAEIIPDLRGMYVEEAEVALAKHGLFPQVIDSVYVRDKKLGTIIEQIPPANSSVKRNRAIYIIINSRQVRQVSIPDLSDVSYRQGEAILKSLGLSIGSVEYSPSEYKDLVIDVKYKGRSLYMGSRIPEGSSLELVVGNGLGDSSVVVPAIKGLNLDDAQKQILNASLVIGATNYDVPPSGNESDYVIYRQLPAAGSTLSAGSHIDVWLSKDKTLLNKTFDEDKKQDSSDEQFF